MTPQQNKLLVFLWDRQMAGGAMPSYQEMADHLGQKSKACSARLLTGLEVAGYVRRAAGQRWRSIEVLRAPGIAGLTLAELRWCADHPSQVRAMMAAG